MERFVWKKKVEQQTEQGLSQRQLAKLEKKKRKQLQLELQKAKERREEREEEKLRWEEEMRRVQRDREALTYQDWEQKEAEFHLEQAKRRAEIRIAEGRPRPIDILYKNLTPSAEGDFDIQEPYMIFQDLQLDELKELRQDIRMYLELDSNKDFWEAMLIVCDDEMARYQQQRQQQQSHHHHHHHHHQQPQQPRRETDAGVHSSIDADVVRIFHGKTFAELQRLQQNIIAKLNSGGAVDVEYWESLLKRLVVYMAQARLREIHEDLLRQRLALLRQRQQEQRAEIDHSIEHYQRKIQELHEPALATKQLEGTADEHADAYDEHDEEDEDYEDGDLLPAGPGDDDDAIDVEDDRAQLALQRQRVLEQQARKLQERASTSSSRPDLSGDDLYLLEAQREMGLDEEAFASEVELTGKVYSWHDKFRPRKPKYFNRVKTGYEWNKYNQTHYDRTCSHISYLMSHTHTHTHTLSLSLSL